MKIAVTSQNFRTITGHAGKTRRFLIYAEDGLGRAKEIARLDLPKEMAMHEFRGNNHPLREVDILITAGCGEGFVRRMAQWGVRVIASSETDPQKAAAAVVNGIELPPAAAHHH